MESMRTSFSLPNQEDPNVRFMSSGGGGGATSGSQFLGISGAGGAPIPGTAGQTGGGIPGV